MWPRPTWYAPKSVSEVTGMVRPSLAQPFARTHPATPPVAASRDWPDWKDGPLLPPHHPGCLTHHPNPSVEEAMARITALVRRFVKNDEAATMVEYALMLSLIAVVCIVAVQLIGTNANAIFNSIAGSLPG